MGAIDGWNMSSIILLKIDLARSVGYIQLGLDSRRTSYPARVLDFGHLHEEMVYMISVVAGLLRR